MRFSLPPSHSIKISKLKRKKMLPVLKRKPRRGQLCFLPPRLTASPWRRREHRGGQVPLRSRQNTEGRWKRL